jgi:hypothetical protein
MHWITHTLRTIRDNLPASPRASSPAPVTTPSLNVSPPHNVGSQTSELSLSGDAYRRDLTPITSVTNLTTSTANSDDNAAQQDVLQADGVRLTAMIGMPWRRPDIAMLAESADDLSQEQGADASTFSREERLAALVCAVSMHEARVRRESMRRVLWEWESLAASHDGRLTVCTGLLHSVTVRLRDAYSSDASLTSGLLLGC